MPKSLSSVLGIDSSEITDCGAFDPILDLDTHLFIDPHLLKHCDVTEFASSYEALQKHFRKIAKLLKANQSIGDPFWKKADSMMEWPEVKGLCIGYSSKGTSGSGIGPELRFRLLKTAKAIIDVGQDDPELFELVGLFEKDFGSDRISDMTANVISEDLSVFTRNVLSSLNVDHTEFLDQDPVSHLPINPFTGKPLLLVPKSILRDLPVALDWRDIDKIAAKNQELRNRVNDLIGDSWKEAISNTTKQELRDIVLANPDLLEDLISTYSNKKAQPYDFLEDRAGEYVWYPVARKFTRDNPLKLMLSGAPSIDEVEALVLTICNQFKVLVEDNGLSSLLYNSDGSLKNETASQLLFYGICESYCDANNIMIARESNSGRGPVDFKFGTNKNNSVLVEIKKSTNTSGLRKGIEKQLPQYLKSEKSRRAIYVVIDVGYTRAAIQNLNEISQQIRSAAIRVLHIDGSIKPSASHL